LWVVRFFCAGGEVEFILGVGIEQLLNDIFSQFSILYSLELAFDFFILLGFPVFFVWVWLKSRKLNQKVYLAGLVVYLFDTLYLVLFDNRFYNKDWLAVVLHLFILWILYKGYKTLKQTKHLVWRKFSDSVTCA